MAKKYLLLLPVFMLICLHVSAQSADTANNGKKIFIRIYDSRNNKIGKGYLLPGKDSSRIYFKRHKEMSFPVQVVAVIKTRRSIWHPILIGTAVGFGAGYILAAASTASDNSGNGEAGFGLAIAAVTAPVAGVITGSVAGALRKRETFRIDGSTEKWMKVEHTILSAK